MSKLIYQNPQEWLKKPLLERLEEIRKLNCTGPCGQSNSTMSKRTCENQTLIETIALIATIKSTLENK